MLMSTMIDCLKRFSKSNDEGGGIDPAPPDVAQLLHTWIAHTKENVKVMIVPHTFVCGVLSVVLHVLCDRNRS